MGTLDFQRELPSPSLDRLGMVSNVEPCFRVPSADSRETRSAQTVDAAYLQLHRDFQRLGAEDRSSLLDRARSRSTRVSGQGGLGACGVGGSVASKSIYCL